jgi:hypothetical protein
MLPWEVEMASDWHIRVGFKMSYPGDLERVEEDHDGKDFISVLKEDLAVFDCNPPPGSESVRVWLPSLKAKERYDRAREELEESHREMVRVVARQ